MDHMIELMSDAISALGGGSRSESLRIALGESVEMYRDDFMYLPLPGELAEKLQDILNGGGYKQQVAQILAESADPVDLPMQNFGALCGVMAGLVMARQQWYNRAIRAEQQVRQIMHDLAASGRIDQLKRDLSDPDIGRPASEYCPAEIDV